MGKDELINESESIIKLKILKELTEQVRKKTKTIGSLKEYIYIEEKKYNQSKSLYAQCVKEIYKDYLSDDSRFLQSCMLNLNRYLSYATGEIYNSTIYNNDYRKKHYKQLNVDIPIDKMEKFEKKLTENNKTKKEVILEWIDKYIEKEK